jgi:hypothetical protein
MGRIVLVALALAAAVPASAQQQVIPPPGVGAAAPPPPPPGPPPPPPGGVSVSGDGRIVISSGVCGALGGTPPGVAGADYVPGVDAQGNAVAPADLPRSAPVATENFPIEIGVDLKKRFGVSSGSQFLRGKGVIGLVTVRDGRAYFNGAPLADNERDMMLAACKETKR